MAYNLIAMTDLSIISVTYNPGDKIDRCLNSLASAAEGISFEVFVVDNASQDGTAAHIAEAFPDVHLVANPDNRGFATANNQALALAQGRYLLLLNPDVIAQPGALAAMVNYLESHPEVGIVGPRVLHPDNQVALTAYPSFTPMVILWQYIGLIKIFPFWFYGRYRKACQAATEPFEVAGVQGSCFMFRREVYDQIGGLDEDFFLFSEENDYCDRAEKAGWCIHYLPMARVTHFESSTVSRYTLTRLRHYHISPLLYFRKRGREGAVWALKFGYILEYLVKSFIRLIQVIFKRDDQAAEHLSVYRTVLGEAWRY